jgi:hypothetical protein
MLAAAASKICIHMAVEVLAFDGAHDKPLVLHLLEVSDNLFDALLVWQPRIDAQR